MADYERSLVTRIIQTGEIENVIARGIDEEHFADEECQEVYGYAIDHLKKYKGAPSMKAVKEQFPEFDPELTEESIDYLIDKHIVNVKRRMANDAILALAEAAEDDERAEDIDIEFLDISRQLATIVPTTAVARFSDMHKRIDQYRKDKKEGNQWGIRMGIPALDEKTFGIQPHELIVCAGWQGTGKALGLDTPIPTPTGWTTQGQIKVGDQLFNEDGKICEVTAIGPVLLNRPCRAVHIAGGETIIADAEHEWKTRDSRGRYRIVESDYIRHHLKREWRDGGTLDHSLDLPAKGIAGLHVLSHLTIHPYVLGVWLGDGHSAGGRITSADDQMVDLLNDYYPSKRHKGSLNIGVEELQTKLFHEQLLQNKHIPIDYLRSPREDRLELLRGLMDSDGSIDERGCCEFTSTRKQLAENVVELICSLGFKPATMIGRAMLDGKDCGPKYRIHFLPGPEPFVFKLDRKIDRQITSAERSKSTRRHIEDVQVVKSEPVRCIQVNSKNGLYLIGKTMVPTHNSTLMQHIGFSGYLQGKKILFVSLEMDRGPLLRKFDTMAVDMSYRELKGLNLPDEAEERWEKWADDAEAGRGHGKDIIIIDRIGSRTATGVYAETIRHKPDLVIVDYISLLETGRTGTEKHWQAIGQISRELKLNAQTLGIPVIAAAQTNRDSVKEGVKLETIAFCVPMGTEILTREGWKTYDEIRPGDETIGFDPDLGCSRWTAINQVHRFDSAPVVEIGHSNWSAQVTPDHQWVGEVSKRRYEGCFKNEQGEWRYKYGPRDWQFSKLTTKDIPMESRIRLAAPFTQLVGREQVSPSEQDAALIGWLLTDGTLQQGETTEYHDRFNKPAAIKAHIFQKKAEQIEIIRSLLEEIDHSEHKSSSGKIQFTIFANEARSLLERSGYNWNPIQFVLSLSPSSLVAFLEACWLAEGWKVGDSGKTMAQNDGSVADAMALAVYLYGQRPSISSNGLYKGKENLNIHFSNAFISGQWVEQRDLPSQQVWCPETELGSWTMRQGKTISLTGNSSAIGMDSDIVLGLMQDEDMRAEEKMEVVMVKNRDGAPGKALMDWRIDSMQFGERPQFLGKKAKGKSKSKAAKDAAKADSPFGKRKGKTASSKSKVVKGKKAAKPKSRKAAKAKPKKAAKPKAKAA